MGAAPLSRRDLNRATLARQGLLEPLTTTPAEAVPRLGSLQAQHPEWPPVALAARAADPATADLGAALDRREVVRSSLMRITIHIVSAADLWAMFTVCQPMRLNQWRLLTKADPVDSPFGRRMLEAHAIAIEALRERPRSSLELDRLMAAAVGSEASPVTRSVPGSEARVVVRAAWRHFAAHVPLVHVPHPAEGYGRSLYALAEAWLGGRETPTMEEARIAVARRYLAAFGPASIDDLLAYVGRGPGGIGAWRAAVDALGDDVVTLASDDGRTMLDLHDAPRPTGEQPVPPRLLARWDSLLLSHASKHRARVIADEHRSAVFTRNADVLPTFVVDGFVAGTWELEVRDGGACVRLRPFETLRTGVRDGLVAEADRVLSILRPNDRRSVVVE